MNTNFFKPAELTETNSNCFLFWWMLFLILAQLWLVEAQDFVATYTPHDDYLFVKLAKHILSGAWLGPYDQVTLIKGPIYPLFIAVAHHTGMPLLLVQHLLYSAICILATMALRPLVKGQWLFMLIFFLLLFNPFTYSYPGTGRAFRFGLSMPLVLALFSCMGGLLLRVKYSLKNKISWSIATSLIFSLLWYTREEGIWILPSLALFVFCFLLLGSQITFTKVLTRFFILLPIPLVFIAFTTTFSHLNQKYYGAPDIIEIKSPEFQSALGGLMNIDIAKSKRYIPVNQENQNAAYAVSPTFKQLQPYFEESKKGAQLPESFYIWVLRDMVRKSGNANSLPEALDFYGKMGAEINAACEAGTISCLNRKATIKPVWRAEYIPLIPATFWDIFKQAISFRTAHFSENEYSKWKTTGSKEMVEDYRFVTREKLVPGHWHHIQAYPKYYMHMIVEKFRILSDIGKGYNKIIPLFFVLSLLVHLAFLVRSIRSRQLDFASMFGLITLGGIISLVSILTYIKITLWPINRPLFSAYPLVLYYISTMAVFSYLFLQKRFKQTNNKKRIVES
ncbi:hypothetical protein JWG39_09520 [Desulforhopalus vacuolatus]|uniref:hypothetical protein n=1 Tax=Desulforhopalus vacuolatus TaxID=40414 RepID=UPI001964A6D6|nr:hypothetical protein [Desulforhopalus vacuolatus]MBM9520051.1 hypothetical protein [Desulforhopalus vacuolatus]